MPGYQFRIKPSSRPMLNRAHGLCQNLMFAACPGWTWGFTASTFQTDYDDYRLQRGIFNTTVPNASPWQGGLFPGGRGIDNGDGSFNSVPEWTTKITGDTRYDINFGFSVACLIRPDVLTTDGSIPFFKHRNQPYSGTEPGWMLTAGAGNTYKFEWSDGVSETNIVSTTTQDIVRGHMLVVTCAPNAAKTTLAVNLYVNGVLEASVGASVLIGNPANTPLKFIGLGTVAAGQPAFSGQVSMGAAWNRVLNASEITRMAGDPFIMWRQPDDLEGLGGLTDFIGNLHKWSLKPRRPAPNRADGLWRNVLHASAPWVWGARADDNLGEYDDISGTRAPWATAGLSDALAFRNENFGRSIQKGTPATNAVPKWPVNGGTRYDISGGGFSFATLVRAHALTTAAVPAYKRRGSPYGVGNAGWGFFPATSGNNWRASISDGTTQVEAVSNTPQDIAQPQLLVAVYDAGGVLSLYVNGVLEDQSAPTALVTASINDATQTLNMLGVGSGSSELDASIGLGVLWNRPLSGGEIRRLYSDPFIMWRNLEDDVGRLASFQTYFHVF